MPTSYALFRRPRLAGLTALLLLTSIGSRVGAQPTTTYGQLPTTAGIAIPTSPVPYPTTGTLRYVDAVNGRNTNTGDTPAAAWQTFEYALTNAPAGSRVIFKSGTYRVATRINLSKTLTLQPEAGATVWIKGSQVVTNWTQVGTTPNWRVTWNQPFPATAKDGRLVSSTNPIAGCLDMVFLDDKPLKQVGRVLSTTFGNADYFKASRNDAAGNPIPVGPGEFCLDYATGELTLGDNPTGKTVEVTALRLGLEIKKHTGSNVLIQGLGFAHFADQPIASGAFNTRIEYNAFAWNALQGFVFYGRYNYTSPTGMPVSEPAAIDNSMKGNLFICNGMMGVSGGQIDGLTFEGNTARWNNCERFATNWSSGGAKFTQSERQVFRNNTFDENWGYALWMDIGAKSPVITSNTVLKNYAGIFFEISDGGLIAGNVAVGNGNGIMIANSMDTRIYNNTLVNNGTNLIVKEVNRRPEAHELGKGSSWITTNTVVKNNILFNNIAPSATSSNLDATPAKTTHATVGNTYGIPVKTTAGSAEMFASAAGLNYNAYYSPTAALVRWTPDGAYNSSGATVTLNYYPTLTGFQTAVPGLETNGLHLTGATDPFFVNAATGDYRLRCNSAATGAGMAVPNDVATALGWPVGTVQLGALRNCVALATGSAKTVASFQLYPNPACDAVTLVFQRTTAQPVELTLLDPLGRLVARQLLPSYVGANRTELHLPTLPSGLYLVRLAGPDGYVSTQRLQIQK